MAKIKFEISGEFEEQTVNDFADYIGFTEDVNITKIVYVENYIKQKMIDLLSIMPIEKQKQIIYNQQEQAIEQIKTTVISDLEQTVTSSSTII